MIEYNEYMDRGVTTDYDPAKAHTHMEFLRRAFNRTTTTQNNFVQDPIQETTADPILPSTPELKLKNYVQNFPTGSKDIIKSRGFAPEIEGTELEPYSDKDLESFGKNYEAYKKRLVEYKPIFEKISAEYGVDPNVITSLAMTESGLRPRAISSTGAIGLMQLHGSTAKAHGITHSSTVTQNIEAGVKEFVKKKSYLRHIHPKATEAELDDLTIRAYNSGQAYWNPRLGKEMSDVKAKENVGHHKRFNYFLYRLREEI